jgi:hypothetical protein
VVRKAYDAFSAGDMEALGKMMKPDMVHSVPGNNSLSGEHKGQDAAFAMYGRLFELTDGTFEADLQDVTAKGDDRVVAKHRSTATRGDKKLDVTTTLDFTVEGDKIARIDESTSDQAAEDAFWS